MKNELSSNRNPTKARWERGRAEQNLLEISREVAGATSEEELVAVVVRGVRGLFPGRNLCVRVVDPRTLALTSLYAEGKIREGVSEPIVVKRSAVAKSHLHLGALPAGQVLVVEEEVPLLFSGSERGLCAPLVASGQLFGVITVEYQPGHSADLEADDRLLVQLANQVAVGIRNAKLIDELTFMRKYQEELVESANALILVLNREQKITVFNRALCQLTGLPKESVLGRDLVELLPESERGRLTRVFHQSLLGERVSFETRLLGGKGREVRVALSTSAVLSMQEEVDGVIAIGQDLTAIRELEKQVIQAEKMASLGQLAASVVHEIKNPMTAVHTYADALLKRSLGLPNVDLGLQKKLRKILDNTERVIRFTGELTSYARPSPGENAAVDLHKTMDLAASFCDHVLAQHSVEVKRSFAELPAVQGVQANLVQVFVNLITNACHAMPPGGVVELSTQAMPGQVVVSVTDSGTGIEPQYISRVFEPFFTTKPEGKGTGLGLSIVQGIVQRHGGTVEVESELGRGTTFRVKLPAPPIP